MTLWIKTPRNIEGIRLFKTNAKVDCKLRLMLLLISFALMVGYSELYMPDPEHPDALSVVLMALAGCFTLSLMPLADYSDWIKRVCKAVAAKETKTFTDFRQLVFIFRINPDVAQGIINGDYDELIMDPYCQKFM